MQIVFGSIIGAFYTPFWAAYDLPLQNSCCDHRNFDGTRLKTIVKNKSFVLHGIDPFTVEVSKPQDITFSSSLELQTISRSIIIDYEIL